MEGGPGAEGMQRLATAEPAFFFFFLVFRAARVGYGSSQLGVESKL